MNLREEEQSRGDEYEYAMMSDSDDEHDLMNDDGEIGEEEKDAIINNGRIERAIAPISWRVRFAKDIENERNDGEGHADAANLEKTSIEASKLRSGRVSKAPDRFEAGPSSGKRNAAQHLLVEEGLEEKIW